MVGVLTWGIWAGGQGPTVPTSGDNENLLRWVRGLVNYLTNLLAQMWVEVGWADLGLDRSLATITFKNQFDKDKFTFSAT